MYGGRKGENGFGRGIGAVARSANNYRNCKSTEAEMVESSNKAVGGNINELYS